VRRGLAIAAATASALFFLLAGPASAHVEVQPSEAAAGQPASFSFRMPNEEPAANTVSLTVRLPADHPVPDVVAPPKDGWAITVTTRPVATGSQVVDSVTWTGSLPPGKADYFNLTTGPLPGDAGELVFDATQTYDNGVVVQWNEVETPGGPEPVHPAPVLRITGGAVAPPTTVAGAAGTTHDHGSESAGATTSSGSGSGLSGGAVLAGVAVAVLAIAGVTTVLYRRVSGPGSAN
jgi:uncharacterized protein YcnI